MIDIQATMKELFGNSCNSYCYAYIAHPSSGIKQLTNCVLKGWNEGNIEDDGYVAKPVQYYNSLMPADNRYIKNVVEVAIRRLDELPDGLYIVEYKVHPDFKESHFVVATNKGVVFDPAGDSNTVRYGAPVSYRKMIYKEAA